MAVLDPLLDNIVIRVVYDGPPMSGKTTSLKMLASGLGGRVVIPQEIDGRTLYFDWLDYTGGLFDGRRIRCQIVSVPGQSTLASRRRLLLASADAVVFVADSAPSAQMSVQRYLEGLQRVLATVEGPPVGVILQANRRDHADAIPLARMRDTLGLSESKAAIIESVATEGSGIREAFVFAVRLALDRVRELMRLDLLQVMRPAIDSADDLMLELQRAEGDSLKLVAETGLRHTRLADVDDTSIARGAFLQVMREDAAAVAVHDAVPTSTESPPPMPGAAIPSGMIWPPVAGRMILHEASAQPRRQWQDSNGDWSGAAGDGWTLHSPKAAVFVELDQAREALLTWARAHASCAAQISEQRCVVLAQDRSSRFRLWQIARTETSLRDHVERALVADVRTITTALLDAVAGFLRAADVWCELPVRLPLSLRKTGGSADEPRYIGTMPYPVLSRVAKRRSQAVIVNQLTIELSFAIPAIKARRVEVLAELDRHSISHPRRETARAFVRRFLGGDGTLTAPLPS